MRTFQNLVNVKKVDATNRNNDLLKELAEIKTAGEILQKWYFTNLLPAGKKIAVYIDWPADKLRAYLLKRIEKRAAGNLKIFENRLQTVFNATNQITEIVISVEWVKNKTWGMCPQATARVCYVDNTCDTFTSSRITGCGYDKESTAVAHALNQCPELLNLLYAIKDLQPTEKNHNIFGYGSGYGLLPSFEGGVGVNCYNTIFEKIGYSFTGVSHGKTFDVYKVVKN